MTGRTKLIIAGSVVAVAAVGTWLGVRAADSGASATTQPAVEAPVATVTTAAVRTGTVAQKVTAYGSVTAQPGVVNVLSVAIECRVRHLRVAGGQAVEPGTPVIEVEPSPDAKLQLVDATNGLGAAKKAAANAHQRFDLKLATVADVQTADDAVRATQAKLDDLTRRGAGADHRTITAEAAAVVAKVDVQEGQLVPAGGPLVELVPRDQIEVRLGMEPDDVDDVRPGHPVQLFPTNGGQATPGTVRLVTRRVSPDTRLVDVFVAPQRPGALLLDGFVRGEFQADAAHGLVVPRAAVLPDDQGFSLFTVEGGKAVKRAAKIVQQDDRDAVVTADGLHAGDAVVIAGNLELDDGTAVAATPTTAPAGDAP